MKGTGLGYYQCYCKEFSKQKLRFPKKSEETCAMYQTDGLTALAMNNAVTVLVSVINIVLRTLNIRLIQLVGIDTQSE